MPNVKPRKKPRTKSKRKPGAQSGNKNALRHGFYSKTFTADENKRLDEQTTIEVEAEINLIRVCLDKLKHELSFDEIIRTDANQSEFRDGHYLQQLNTLTLMTQSISTLVRTHYLIHGKSGDIQSSILQALEELRLEMGL